MAEERSCSRKANRAPIPSVEEQHQTAGNSAKLRLFVGWWEPWVPGGFEGRRCLAHLCCVMGCGGFERGVLRTSLAIREACRRRCRRCFDDGRRCADRTAPGRRSEARYCSTFLEAGACAQRCWCVADVPMSCDAFPPAPDSWGAALRSEWGDRIPSVRQAR